MPKSCPICSATNKDEALFCKACGASLADVHAASTVDPTVGSVTCSDCGHVNRPHTRYCARCGVNLEGTVILPRPRAPAAQPPGTDPYAAADPLQAYERTETYPPVAAPYPQEPAYAPAYPPAYAPAPAYAATPAYAPTAGYEAEDTLPPQQAEWPEPPTAAPVAPVDAPADAKSSGPLLWIVLVLVAALALGGALWWFLSRPLVPPPEAKAPIEQPAPVVTAPAAPDASALAASAAAAASAAEATPAPPVASVPAAPETAPPTAPAAQAPALPNAANTAPLPGAAPADPAREAALKQARDKARRDKAEADARARQQAQRDQELGRQKAEQDGAAARRRAEAERQARATAPLAPAAAAPAQGVNEICAGRNMISRSICEVRECESAAHAGEAICKEVRDREERRRARQNLIN